MNCIEGNTVPFMFLFFLGNATANNHSGDATIQNQRCVPLVRAMPIGNKATRTQPKAGGWWA